VVTGGPLVGVRVGFFPSRRVGLEGELAFISGGYADKQSGSARFVASRGQLAIRAFDRGRFGIRALLGAGAYTASERTTSSLATQAEVHGGVALTVAASPNLWVRFQIADQVTTARDDGYAHCVELQLGLVTRVGRRDAW
jgi:hypothetical protein